MRWRIRTPSQQFHHPGSWDSCSRYNRILDLLAVLLGAQVMLAAVLQVHQVGSLDAESLFQAQDAICCHGPFAADQLIHSQPAWPRWNSGHRPQPHVTSLRGLAASIRRQGICAAGAPPGSEEPPVPPEKPAILPSWPASSISSPASLAVTLVLAIIRLTASQKLNEVDCYKMYRDLTGFGVLPILLNKSLDSDGNSTQLRKKLLACPPYFDSKPLLHDRTAESLVW